MSNSELYTAIGEEGKEAHQLYKELCSISERYNFRLFVSVLMNIVAAGSVSNKIPEEYFIKSLSALYQAHMKDMKDKEKNDDNSK